jgi:Ulp1 family protease
MHCNVISDSLAGRLRLHIPLTYFYSRLSDDGRGYHFAGVQRWMRKVDLFPSADTQQAAVDAVLIPLHLTRKNTSNPLLQSCFG